MVKTGPITKGRNTIHHGAVPQKEENSKQPNLSNLLPPPSSAGTMTTSSPSPSPALLSSSTSSPLSDLTNRYAELESAYLDFQLESKSIESELESTIEFLTKENEKLTHSINRVKNDMELQVEELKSFSSQQEHQLNSKQFQYTKID